MLAVNKKYAVEMAKKSARQGSSQQEQIAVIR